MSGMSCSESKKVFIEQDNVIPKFQKFLLPVLEACSERPRSTRDVIPELANKFGLSDEELAQLVPSGQQTTFSNRITWAKTFLKKAGLVHYPARGEYAITEEGKRVLLSKPAHIDNKFLMQYEGFRDFYRAKKEARARQSAADEADNASLSSDDESTPEERFRMIHKQMEAVLADELLDRIRSSTPRFFEHLIVELLSSMGYGGAASDSARVLGGSGDDGVDGVIDQDHLGVDQVYVQAKRYAADNKIGSGAIRDFFGALSLKKAQKGIFFTSSGFSESARRTAKDLGARIVLIDGERLARLMIEHNVGCRQGDVIELKKIDEDFFDQEI